MSDVLHPWVSRALKDVVDRPAAEGQSPLLRLRLGLVIVHTKAQPRMLDRVGSGTRPLVRLTSHLEPV